MTIPSAPTVPRAPNLLNDSTRLLFMLRKMGRTDFRARLTPPSPQDIERLKSGRYRKLIESLGKSTPKRTRSSDRASINRTQAARLRGRAIEHLWTR